MTIRRRNDKVSPPTTTHTLTHTPTHTHAHMRAHMARTPHTHTYTHAHTHTQYTNLFPPFLSHHLRVLSLFLSLSLSPFKFLKGGHGLYEGGVDPMDIAQVLGVIKVVRGY